MTPLVLPLLLLLGSGPLVGGQVLRVGMETRGMPAIFVPGLDYAKEDLRKPAKVTAAQLKKLEGAEVDIMNGLARRLGTTPQVVPTIWFDLEKDLLANRFDIILCTWTPSLKTPPEILASSPYLEWGLVVAVSADSPVRTLLDLAGRKVGHFPDPAVEQALKVMRTGIGGEFLEARSSAEELFDDLAAGKIDALIFDSPYVLWRIKNDRGFRIVGEPLNRLGYHVGVRKEDAALLLRIDAAIHEMNASGELAEIRRRWEGDTTGR